MADEPSAPPTTALITPEVIDLAAARVAFAGVPEDVRPRSADPLFELGRILGPELVCTLVKEAEQIHDRCASTHVDVRLHFVEGLPRRADWMPFRAVNIGTPRRR